MRVENVWESAADGENKRQKPLETNLLDTIEIGQELIERDGIPMAIVAHETGVTTTAISKIMRRCRS